MGVTAKLWLQAITQSINGLITASALFATLFGQTETLKIIAILGIINIVVGTVVTTFSTQTATVKDVLAMPGIDPVQVNAQASKALASLAMDQTVNKIGPAPTAVEAVARIAAS